MFSFTIMNLILFGIVIVLNVNAGEAPVSVAYVAR